jgi:hypothetical protein
MDAMLSETDEAGVPVAYHYLTASDEEREWTHETGRAVTHTLVHAARALAAMPIPKPPNA